MDVEAAGWAPIREDRVDPLVAVFLVEREDPFIVSCAACGGVTQLWTHDPVELLPWRVVEHWLAVHWDRDGLDEGGSR